MDSLLSRALDVAIGALRKVQCNDDIDAFFEKADRGEIDIRLLETFHIKQVLRGQVQTQVWMKMISMLVAGKGKCLVGLYQFLFKRVVF
jgi:hypothetical protein